jgi:hypothetical protein
MWLRLALALRQEQAGSPVWVTMSDRQFCDDRYFLSTYWVLALF